MSRIAKDPVNIPSGVTASQNASILLLKGPKGEMSLNVNQDVSLEISEKSIQVLWVGDENKAIAGTMRALIANNVHGVSEGFTKNIKLNGVGYRAKVQGKQLVLTLGYSHPVEYTLPDQVEAKSENQTEFNLTSIDKQILGQVCSEIRAFRPPEPYKGKGIFIDNEHVVRKERKKASTA